MKVGYGKDWVAFVVFFLKTIYPEGIPVSKIKEFFPNLKRVNAYLSELKKEGLIIKPKQSVEDKNKEVYGIWDINEGLFFKKYFVDELSSITFLEKEKIHKIKEYVTNPFTRAFMLSIIKEDVLKIHPTVYSIFRLLLHLQSQSQFIEPYLEFKNKFLKEENERKTWEILVEKIMYTSAFSNDENLKKLMAEVYGIYFVKLIEELGYDSYIKWLEQGYNLRDLIPIFEEFLKARNSILFAIYNMIRDSYHALFSLGRFYELMRLKNKLKDKKSLDEETLNEELRNLIVSPEFLVLVLLKLLKTDKISVSPENERKQ